jgi:hypothetical protein
MPLPRNCERCGNRFQPNTQTNRLCLDCRRKVIHENFIKLLNHRLLIKSQNKFLKGGK